LVYDTKKYTISEIKDALVNNFEGQDYVVLQNHLKNKAPKYGNDDDQADDMARSVMEVWAKETWKYKTQTNFQFRPGMLSWNYWAGADASYTPATPDGRLAGTFLSNAICPSAGVDKKGPTAVTNSVGVALGGKTEDGGYINYLPNGASHTITFNPSILRNPENRDKFKAYLKGYIENGGTSLQVNMLDADMLRDAQLHPENYKNLLVRVTGYNAYFNAIGKELQDEIIARESHNI
jgi:pyruvate-formate lyase